MPLKSAFHTRACTQLGDVLAPQVAKSGGMMTLPDVYCLFNRARGAELVSPNDMLQAAAHLTDVGAGLQLHTLPSGASLQNIVVLQRMVGVCNAPWGLVRVHRPLRWNSGAGTVHSLVVWAPSPGTILLGVCVATDNVPTQAWLWCRARPSAPPRSLPSSSR